MKDDSNQTTASDYQSKSSRVGFREGFWIADFWLDQTAAWNQIDTGHIHHSRSYEVVNFFFRLLQLKTNFPFCVSVYVEDVFKVIIQQFAAECDIHSCLWNHVSFTNCKNKYHQHHHSSFKRSICSRLGYS